MADYSKFSLKGIVKGLALSVVDDLRSEGRFKYLQNVRIFTTGIIESRPRLNNFLTLTGSVNQVPHSIKTIIDKATGNFNRIVGAGTKLYTGNGLALAEKATGFSGKPLSQISFRPEESVEAYNYIADENKFVKVSVSDTLSDVGINPPQKATTWQITKPERKILDSIEAGSEGDWNHLTGSASAPTLETRVNTTIVAYLKDALEPNFASIVPTAFTPDIQKGAILKLNASEEVIVEEVLPAVLKTGIATISKISYDVGTAGFATIVLSVSSSDIIRDSILLLNGTEYVRVQDVTFDDKGIPSIRVFTIGTFAATNTISGVDSFRIFATVAYAAGNTIIGKYVKSAITASGISSITRTFNIDLSNTGIKALSPEDVFHISIKPSDPAALIEIQIQFNIGSTGVAFQENYFYYVITPNFFTGSAQQTASTLAVIQQANQRQDLLDQQIAQQNIFNKIQQSSESGGYDPGIYAAQDVILPNQTSLGLVTETTLGQTQWTELEILLSDILNSRVGSDLSRTLKDVNAIRISVNANVAVDISIDSLWIGGSNALNSNPTQGFLPYNYVWRVRNPATKEPSNWSPPLRTGIKLSRGNVVLSFPDANTTYPVSYKIDIARFGGTLNDFRIVGSIKNDGSTYTDTSSDRLIADNELAGRLEGGNTDAVFDFYKPFATLDTPKVGTCDIIGTGFTWKTGDKLNTSYPRGTLILINGKANRFYSNPTSTTTADVATKVELELDMGSLTDVVFEILSPLLTGQTLPIIFGSFGEGNFGLFFFGLGDKKNAGTLYWLDGNSPGTMSDLNSLEITSPSEPLMSGVIYDGLGYVYTTKKSFQLVPTFNGSQFSFIARENSNSRGLYSRYAICVGRDFIYSLSENADGIYRVPGNGNPQLITEGLDNLFYNNGKQPSLITLIDGTLVYPPDFSKKDDLRLFHVSDYVFFRFIDTNNEQRTIVLNETLNDWISFDSYKNGICGAIYHEEKESGTDILVGINDGVAKFENAGNYEAGVLSKIIPFAFDGGDSRINKLFSEIIENLDQGLLGFTYQTFWNNGDSNETTIIIPANVGHKRQQFIQQINNGLGLSKQNTITILSWDISSGTKFYERIIYFIPQADEIKDRAGDFEFGGGISEKLWQGIIIQADTSGKDKELKFYDDRNILRATLNINHNGKQTIAYSFDTPDSPFISHSIRRTSDDGVLWTVFTEAFVYDVEPESANTWEGEFSISNIPDLHLVNRMSIAYRSLADANIKLKFDNASDFVDYPLPASTNNYHIEQFYIACVKWKTCKWRIESTEPIRVYKKAMQIWCKGTTSKESFQPISVLGGNSNVRDAEI